MVPVNVPYCGNLPPTAPEEKVISLEREMRKAPFPIHGLETAEKHQQPTAGTLTAKGFMYKMLLLLATQHKTTICTLSQLICPFQ